MIHAIATSRRHRWVVVVLDKLGTGEPLTGHDGRVWAGRFGEPDGPPVAISGGEDGTARVWDLAAGAQPGEPLTGHELPGVGGGFGEPGVSQV